MSNQQPAPSTYAPAFPAGPFQEQNMSTYSPVPVQTVPAADPARTLGVVGLILSVVASVVGLIVSVVAFRTSKRAGFKNTPALAGIVVGIITTLGVLTASIAGGVAAGKLVDTCKNLGPGTHVVNGVTYTCG